MNLRSSLTLLIFATTLVVVACSQKVTTSTSPAGALISNQAIANAAPRLFDRRRLDVGGFHNLNEFIRPDVRQRLDQEPGEEGNVSPPVVSERGDEAPEEQQEAYNEDNPDKDAELEKVKFSWARKKFGDALAAEPTSRAVIVLYADDNFYDIGHLVYYVEQGRDRIAETAAIDAQRIQVMYAGYRGAAQVEFWIVPEGQDMPEIKADDRDDPRDAEN